MTRSLGLIAGLAAVLTAPQLAFILFILIGVVLVIVWRAKHAVARWGGR
ncbi:hypothetical protein [Nocardia sp. NPDC050710]